MYEYKILIPFEIFGVIFYIVKNSTTQCSKISSLNSSLTLIAPGNFLYLVVRIHQCALKSADKVRVVVRFYEQFRRPAPN